MSDLDSEFRDLVSMLKKRGLSQREIADRLGKSSSYITQKLSRYRRVTRMDVLALRQLIDEDHA